MGNRTRAAAHFERRRSRLPTRAKPDPARSKNFKALYNAIVNEYPPELRDEIRRKLESDPGIKALPGGHLEVDPSKFAAGELHWAFRRVTGSDCDVLPSYIDEDLYNHLVELKPGTHARELYRADLAAKLPADAVVETALRLKDGKDVTPAVRVPEALADILCEVDRANRLAAKAAFGDREALREYVESDPALDGLDRLYCMDVVNALIRMHEDVLTRF